MKAPLRLALDCSAESLSLALQVSEDTYITRAQKGSRTSDLLPIFLQEIFTESGATAQNLSEIRLTVGPGSFTGIRLGLATAEALKRLNPSIHIRAFSSLQALAMQLAPQPEAFSILLDAAGGQAYSQTFHPNGTPASDPACIPQSPSPNPHVTVYAPTTLMLAAKPLPALEAPTLFTLPASLELPAQPLYLKPLTYKKVGE